MLVSPVLRINSFWNRPERFPYLGVVAVEALGLAVGALGASDARDHLALEDNLGMGRYEQVACLALDQLGGTATPPSRGLVLGAAVLTRRDRSARGQGEQRVQTEDERERRR